jgi:hypothetical protein
VIRFLLEAGFLILVAAAVGLADLGWVWITVVMFCAWLLNRDHRADRGPPERAARARAGGCRRRAAGAAGGGTGARA